MELFFLELFLVGGMMLDYNDYELVSLAKEGNEDAVNLIYQKIK